MNRHYVKLNKTGERETSIAYNVHFTTEEELQPYLEQGFIPITDEEQELYATNQYLRGENGNSIEKSPYMPTTEEKMVAIRVKRNHLLAESDKYMMLDYPISNEQREVWKFYRQFLRDMPEICDPDNPVWPVPPQ